MISELMKVTVTCDKNKNRISHKQFIQINPQVRKDNTEVWEGDNRHKSRNAALYYSFL